MRLGIAAPLAAIVTALVAVTATASNGTLVAAGAPSQTAKQKAWDAQATKLLRNGRYVGSRGDGEPVDLALCANGRRVSQTGNAISKGKWLVRTSTFTKNGFTAIVAENKDRRKGGWAIAVGRQKGKWLYGIESFDQATSMGSVKRGPAGTACR